MTQTPAPEPIGTSSYGFDIIIDGGESHTPSTTTISDDDDGGDSGLPGAEPPTPYWDRRQADIIDPAEVLNGHRYSMRYWVEFDIDGETSYDYGVWELLSQTIEIIDPQPPLYTTRNGDELFTMLPGDGTNLNNKGGIKDGTMYDYLSVFDEAELSWLPRASTYDQEFIDQRYLPQVDDTENRLPDPQFSMDTCSAFVPDERLEIIVSYRVTTTFRAPSFGVTPGVYDPVEDTWTDPTLNIDNSGNRDNWTTRTFSFIIRQVVFQDLSDIVDKLKKVLDACYFTHGYNHIQLYDIDAAPNYDEDANPIGPVIQPLYEKDEERSELVGFDVFKLINTVADTTTVNEGEIQDAETTRDEQLEEMIRPLLPLMDVTEKAIKKELEGIEQNQKDYEEEIRLNEERQDKLISNLVNQINPDSNYLDSGGDSQFTFEELMQMVIDRRTTVSENTGEEYEE